MEDIARQLALQVSEQLPDILRRLHKNGFNLERQLLQLECNLTTGDAGPSSTNNRVRVAAINIGTAFIPVSSSGTPHPDCFPEHRKESLALVHNSQSTSPPEIRRMDAVPISPESMDSRPIKRRKLGDGVTSHPSEGSAETSNEQVTTSSFVRSHEHHRKKRIPDNPDLQPSTLDKFVGGVWKSIFSGIPMDPTENIQQWQAIESDGHPKLLTDTEQRITHHEDTGAFGRMNFLTRRISQTSRTCKSLEVVVQAHWIQCFENHVSELAVNLSIEKARKAAITEACIDFNWTDKELRNKMAIWRGYYDIKCTAGWAALVFAGMGLYRFCKYRVFFTDETFDILRRLRHRLEVAADTLHPRWRILLGIIGESTQPKYTGHPHDFVVNGPGNEAIPLPETYHQWDRDFSYTHLESSIIDVDAWDEYDPRTVIPEGDDTAHKCQVCGEMQSNDPKRNSCACYPNLYGTPKAGMVPVQIFRTPDGKNNGLLACCAFEKGWAVGEFIGLITSGLAGLDVMVGQVDNAAAYQIWQGRQGNHTRFVNHSCRPNSHFERFVWLDKQRIVLVSHGIEPGEEITVDYGSTYWEVSRVALAPYLIPEPKVRHICAKSPPSSSKFAAVICNKFVHPNH